MDILLRAVIHAAQEASEAGLTPPATVEESYAFLIWIGAVVLALIGVGVANKFFGVRIRIPFVTYRNGDKPC